MPKYTVPPFTPEDDPSPDFDRSLVSPSVPMNRLPPRNTGSPSRKALLEKRVTGGTRNHQKNGWIRGK